MCRKQPARLKFQARCANARNEVPFCLQVWRELIIVYAFFTLPPKNNKLTGVSEKTISFSSMFLHFPPLCSIFLFLLDVLGKPFSPQRTPTGLPPSTGLHSTGRPRLGAAPGGPAADGQRRIRRGQGSEPSIRGNRGDRGELRACGSCACAGRGASAGRLFGFTKGVAFVLFVLAKHDFLMAA